MKRAFAAGLAIATLGAALVACNAILSIDDIADAPDAGDDAPIVVSTIDAATDHAAAPSLDASSDGAIDEARDAGDSGSVDADPCATSAGDACAVLTQCGCGANLECAYDTNHGEGTTCIPIGPAQEHEGCETRDCARGLSCTDGMCHRYCALDAGCEGDPFPSQCLLSGGTSDAPFAFCAFDCDLADPAACGDASVAGGGPIACTFLFGNVTECLYRQVATPCTSERTCAPAMTCVDGGVCAPWCKLDAGAGGCANGKSCVALGAPVVVAAGSYGACE